MRRRCGFTLTELLVAAAVIGILAAIAIGRYRRTAEQCRLNMAAQQLQGIWMAQRVYHQEQHFYTGDLSDLSAMGLVDPQLNASRYFTFSIAAATDGAFQAVAVRRSGSAFTGQITIDQDGVSSGSIIDSGGGALTPASF